MAQAVDPQKTTSPKVIGATLLALLATIVTTGVAALTPDMYAAMGIFGPIAQAILIAVATWFGGWVKSDPLRVNTSIPGKGTMVPDLDTPPAAQSPLPVFNVANDDKA